MNRLPYFDYLLASLETDDKTVEKSFGRHVHWGYWENPKQASLTVDDFAQATENLSRLLINAAEITDGQTVLDVGCGFGGTIASLNETFATMRLVGLNIDERQLDRARQKVHAAGNNSIDFQQGDACALPFADHSFDVILAVECIFHFPSREQFFKEAYRVLKPGGHLALSDFIVSNYLPRKLPGHINSGFFGTCNVQFTQQKYHDLANKSGFAICSEKDITRNTLPTYRYLKSLLVGKSRSNPLGLFIGLCTTLVIEIITRLRLLSYFAFAFKKPA